MALLFCALPINSITITRLKDYSLSLIVFVWNDGILVYMKTFTKINKQSPHEDNLHVSHHGATTPVVV